MFRGLVDTSVHFSGDVYRNISTILVSEFLLDDLTDSPTAWAYGEEIVAQLEKLTTSPRSSPARLSMARL